ncbi:thioredoxin-dependent thiol peroxidase [Flexibacterium corallicola]|uniref:thioredoxin-dependent thiol peroxidase n=1 Tax=Flexibacterium corallicola TaxID=3037259 RepID=UPI00286ECD29|nr:thioredoxin-dependent thiol peroxidase [Pseudovibrio sp. M1P-2-3]
MSSTKLEPGALAPDFQLPTDGDGSFSLSDKKGSIVVLYFYPKDNTPGCTKESIAFSQLKPEFDALGASVVGVSPDTAAKHDKFKAKHELNVTLVSDTETTLCENYGVWVQKSMFGKKYMGVERSTFLIGADGHIAKVWRKVKVAGHAEDVLEAVKDLGTQ